MRIELSRDEIEMNPFWDGFFPMVVKKATGRAYREVESFDNKKIKVTPDIFKAWFSKAKEEGIPKVELKRMLNVAGPGSVSAGKSVVEIERGAFTFEDGISFPE